MTRRLEEMKILLLGGRGMLGSDCREMLSQDYEIIAPDKKELDIVSWDRVIDTLQHTRPNIILNCAAVTRVNACEEHKTRILCRKVNVEGPRNLAQGSARFASKVIHISSDFVFNGVKAIPQPYFEDDALDPVSEYGRSKMESEMAVKENASDYLILRTGWLYGVGGKNFVKSLLAQALDKKKGKKTKVPDDYYGSPTWSYRLAEQIKELIEADGKGTIHATAEGYCSFYEAAKFVVEKLNLKLTIEPCRLQDMHKKAKRPANCILENRALKKNGLNRMKPWQEDLLHFLDRFGEALVKQVKEGSRG
jgi:dTDP-4-dehydrorhamnose reductase